MVVHSSQTTESIRRFSSVSSRILRCNVRLPFISQILCRPARADVWPIEFRIYPVFLPSVPSGLNRYILDMDMRWSNCSWIATKRFPIYDVLVSWRYTWPNHDNSRCVAVDAEDPEVRLGHVAKMALMSLETTCPSYGESSRRHGPGRSGWKGMGNRKIHGVWTTQRSNVGEFGVRLVNPHQRNRKQGHMPEAYVARQPYNLG